MSEIDTAVFRARWDEEALIPSVEMYALCDALDEARVEGAAYRKAKQENDERFQLDAATQRMRAEQAEAKLARVEAWVNRIEMYYGDVPQRFSIAADARFALQAES